MNEQMDISCKYNSAVSFKLIFSLFIYPTASYSIIFNLK